jgi:hypothetical protein
MPKAAPKTATRGPRRLAPALVAVLGLLACTDEPAPEPDDHVAVKLTFDQITYVDATLAPRKVMERIRSEVQSIFPALRRADALLLTNQQVEIDVARLKKDAVTVVDPGHEAVASRAVLRVHHHYVALAQVPKALADKGEIPLGVLHGNDAARAGAVLAECTANGEREREAVGELWTVFDPSLERCAAAMTRERAAIDAARQKLQHPEREIVPIELGRSYLPVVVHLQRRHADDAGAYALPHGGEHVDDPTVRAPGYPDIPGPPSPAGEQPTFVQREANAEEQAAPPPDPEASEDEAELRRQARALGGDVLANAAAPPPPSYGGYRYLQPNYAIVYFALVVFVLFVVGKRRQQGRR